MSSITKSEAPERLYVSVMSSTSVASTFVPTSSPGWALSETVRVVISVSNSGASLTALMVTVTRAAGLVSILTGSSSLAVYMNVYVSWSSLAGV